MRKTLNKNKKELFVSSVVSIRDELTERAKELTSTSHISMDNAKLIKEITTIIKELDKLIREQESDSSGALATSDFYTLLKSRTLLDDNFNEQLNEFDDE